MSFIVKGIDMPKEGELHLIITKNGIIYGAEYPNKIKHAYPLNLEAQAIQIPKGHGRLGDLDYLYDRFKSNKCPDENVYRLIREEPTILEAEE